MATSLSSNVDSRKATNTLYVMMIIQQFLQSSVRTTLRAVYYKVLNIVGADKGKVIGNLCYTMEGDRIECFKRSQVIPHSK
ncbi:type IIB DNA topoisomerase [Medicago truncatula]|uniref:Type IIB DNA topoisomerase n=1 Tax=Medicago truncatula TaxID=3880 RepID=G7L240_MEDTR|nr:type IIB DNA topoisomerase [Medicago truncatula]